jgi:predicted PurR-regulated permease PerM
MGMDNMFGTALGMILVFIVGLFLIFLAITWIVLPFIIMQIRGRLDRLDDSINLMNATLMNIGKAVGPKITVNGEPADPPAVESLRSDIQSVAGHVEKTNRILMAVHNVEE